jgi:hypothetical protein
MVSHEFHELTLKGICGISFVEIRVIRGSKINND